MLTMIFDKPIPFAEALAHRQARVLLPTYLGSKELGEIDAAIRERATALARVTNATYVQRASDLATQVVEGKLTQDKARQLMLELRSSLNYRAPEGKSGTMQDLFSDQRLGLVIRMLVEQANGYGQWRQGQSEAVLRVWPCSELYRAAWRKEPRDWPAVWSANGGSFYHPGGNYPEGRMIAPKDSPIWSAISRFGLPYPPFDFNSGMDLRDVSRAEAVRLGVIEKDYKPEPQRRSFELDAASSGEQFDEVIRKQLLDDLGPGYEFEDGVLRVANETAPQLANRTTILQIANGLRHERLRRGTCFANDRGDSGTSAKAVVTNDRGEVLVLKDARSDWNDLPGGHVKDGESVEQGLRREVREETGLELSDVRRERDQWLELGGRTTNVVFHSATANGTPVLSDEHSGFEWVAPARLGEFNLGVLAEAARDFAGKEATCN